MFKYTLSNLRRVDCPFCGKRGKYSAYINNATQEFAPVEYGMCSSCQESKRPPDNYIVDGSVSVTNNEIGYFEADKVHIGIINQLNKASFSVCNTLLDGLELKFGAEGVKRVTELYKLGCFQDSYGGESSAIVFPYLHTDTHCCTGKLMWFDEDLHRIKEGKKQYPRFLHNLNYTDDRGRGYDFNNYDDAGEIVPFKLKMSLFGHNQIINEKHKTICLVESEKTAVIMSIVLPEFIWVASGGKTLIQDYKFLFFTGRKCLVFPDLSADDNVWLYWSEKLMKYSRKYGYEFEIVDYYGEFLKYDSELIRFCKCEGKFDVADFVLEFNKNDCYVNYLKNKLGLSTTH
ncbi:MAG: hypothetical protein JXR36_08995 [Bacteroidales bacterium]|nr:hypothetical protein [Bacteroidales bacterium]